MILFKIVNEIFRESEKMEQPYDYFNEENEIIGELEILLLVEMFMNHYDF